MSVSFSVDSVNARPEAINRIDDGAMTEMTLNENWRMAPARLGVPSIVRDYQKCSGLVRGVRHPETSII
ncbi:hypothetical protein CONPUDRAFT_154074 [Coniophora puteana RWD-64-598 SS2]|uniref:Uncharacterized protein n=1 Tax=Coniophora puteana (strain RWD-64-598) TaxID=741705 RepID=A0A5M3MQQ9_CONPW|nr:uncharacterized protein CONPUDRAFT_154074 [Coniophora puteana RWD-64-598 SS2]EIW81538.1 hypothetical protein CONPUDRAFT_154074 [Coniophora puteana RWD-64-598 SS2]